jgi:hypothetical protein
VIPRHVERDKVPPKSKNVSVVEIVQEPQRVLTDVSTSFSNVLMPEAHPDQTKVKVSDLLLRLSLLKLRLHISGTTSDYFPTYETVGMETYGKAQTEAAWIGMCSIRSPTLSKPLSSTILTFSVSNGP